MSSGDQPVPLIIGGASSITAQILSRALGPLSVPLVSYIQFQSFIGVGFEYIKRNLKLIKIEIQYEKNENLIFFFLEYLNSNVKMWFSLCKAIFHKFWCINSSPFMFSPL